MSWKCATSDHMIEIAIWVGLSVWCGFGVLTQGQMLVTESTLIFRFALGQPSANLDRINSANIPSIRFAGHFLDTR